MPLIIDTAPSVRGAPGLRKPLGNGSAIFAGTIE